MELDFRELTDPLSWGRRALRDISLSEAGSTPTKGSLIVLVGKSQVGKTTLAMRLLGASPEESAALSRKLRGGSLQGESGTPSTSMYVATGRINDPRSWEDHLSELEKQAIRVRRSQTARSFENIETYHIPVDAGLTGSIIDTEGLEPRSDDERERSLEAVRKWLLRADFALYVSADDLIQDLSPTDRALDPAYDLLRSSPKQCVVALTSAYELPTIRDCLDNCDTPEKLLVTATEHYKNVLLGEVFTGIEEALMPLVVPLSLKALQHDSKNKEKVESATELALEQIRSIFDNDINRICLGFTLSKLYMKRINELETTGQDRVDTIEQCYTQQRIKLRKLLSQRRDLATRIAVISNALRDETIACEIESTLRSLIESTSNEIKSQTYKRPVNLVRGSYVNMILSGLSDSIGALADVAKDCLESWRSSLPISIQDFIVDEARSVALRINEIMVEAAEIDSDCKKYVIRKGFWGGVKEDESIENASAFFADIKERLLESIEEVFLEGLKNPLHKWWGVQKRNNVKMAQALQIRKTDLETTILEAIRQTQAARQEVDRARSVLESSIARYRNLQEKADDFGNRLASEYENQWNSLVEIGNRCSSPEDKLLVIAVLNRMKENLGKVSEWCHQDRTA